VADPGSLHNVPSMYVQGGNTALHESGVRLARRMMRPRAASSWSVIDDLVRGPGDRNRAQIVLQSSLSRAALDVCEAMALELLLGAARSVARNDTTFSRSCLSARPGNIILTPGRYRRGALR
jgi:hypothetical protein